MVTGQAITTELSTSPPAEAVKYGFDPAANGRRPLSGWI